MKEFEVTCINKPDRFSSHEHITHIGNIDGHRSTGKKVYVGVVRGDGNKAPYLRTYADGKWNDNLLALAECNGACQLVG